MKAPATTSSNVSQTGSKYPLRDSNDRLSAHKYRTPLNIALIGTIVTDLEGCKLPRLSSDCVISDVMCVNKYVVLIEIIYKEFH